MSWTRRPLHCSQHISRCALSFEGFITSTGTLDLLDDLLALFLMPSKDHSLSICHLDFFSLYVTDPALGGRFCESHGVWFHKPYRCMGSFTWRATPNSRCGCPETQLPPMLGAILGLCVLALSSGPFYHGYAYLPEIQISQSWPLDLFFVYY